MARQIFTIGTIVIALTVSTLIASQGGRLQEQALTRTAADPQLQWGPCPAFMPTGCTLTVLHGDPAKPNADVFLKLPANSEIADHWHTSAERMILVAGEMRVTYKGQATVTLTPGTYAYGPAKAPHTASCVGNAPCVLFIAFESPVDAVETKPTKK